jgi:hypothetical protein
MVNTSATPAALLGLPWSPVTGLPTNRLLHSSRPPGRRVSSYFRSTAGSPSGLPPGLPPGLLSGLRCCAPILSGFSLRRVNDAVRSLCSIEPTCNILNCNKKLNLSKTLKNVERNILKKINNFQTVLTLCSLAISNVFSFSNICSAFKVNSAKRPFITMQVQGVTSSWLFDTGPAASVMALSEF